MKIKIINNGSYKTNGRIKFPLIVEDKDAVVLEDNQVIDISVDVLVSAGFTELGWLSKAAFCLKGHEFGEEAVIL